MYKKNPLQYRYWTLAAADPESREARHLWVALGGEVQLDWEQRDRVQRWLAAAREEGYGGLKAAPEGEVHTIASRLEAAAASWGGFVCGWRTL